MSLSTSSPQSNSQFNSREKPLPRLLLSKAAASRILGYGIDLIDHIQEDEYGIVVELKDASEEILTPDDFWGEFKRFRLEGGRGLAQQVEYLGAASGGEPTWQVNDKQVCWHPGEKTFSCSCHDACAQAEIDLSPQCKHVYAVAIRMGAKSLKQATEMLDAGHPQQIPARPEPRRNQAAAVSAASLYQAPRPDDMVGHVSIA